ncbi:UBX domain-containing protein 6 [Pteropus vampyrus]|uniref:UBX domain-containing protein 6 n=1 Tax=Pteropus vampyrus TaxID=132908 RepID=A0A6P6BYS0_PTEVA|nr:UBX domain-containing protein 6 [Pteropus vampyrus]
MKKFFQEIKSDIKFKSAGPGQKLTESVGCVTGLALGTEQDPYTDPSLPLPAVRKELRAEATVSGSPEAPGTNMVPEPKEEGSTHLAVPGVYFICPLTGALLRKDQRDSHVKEAIASPLRATLARQRRVFRPSPLASQFDLPADFFGLTAEEVKREQRLRSEAVERLSMLRTKAMREKEEQREMRKYTYTLLRVRLPDGCLLQGTFYARERVAVLYSFVREALQSDWLPFELLASGGQKLSEDENLAFNECGLVPSALLTFSWDAAVLEDIKAAGAEPESILKPELLSAIEKLS